MCRRVSTLKLYDFNFRCRGLGDRPINRSSEKKVPERASAFLVSMGELYALADCSSKLADMRGISTAILKSTPRHSVSRSSISAPLPSFACRRMETISNSVKFDRFVFLKRLRRQPPRARLLICAKSTDASTSEENTIMSHIISRVSLTPLRARCT